MKRGIAFLIVLLLALPACGDNRDDLIAELQQLQSSAQAVRGNPRAVEIDGPLDDVDAAIAAAVAAAQALPPDFVPDPDYLSTVTADSIITGAGDVLPRQAIDFTTDQDGEWHDAATWGGIVPPANANCQINHQVTFGVQDVQPYTYVEVTEGASLSFLGGAEMRVQTLAYHPGSTLRIGTAGSPIPLANPVEIVFRDLPFPAEDDDEMSNGLICFGAVVRMYGEAKAPWVRCDEAVSPGEAVGDLDLQAVPLNWEADDTVVISATRQVFLAGGDRNYGGTGGHDVVQWPGGQATVEHPEIASVQTGRRVTPVLANLDRAITLRSENPSGVRAHGMATGRSEVYIEGVCFTDMGRTLATLSIQNAGNQIGRYPWHFHHCIGPVASSLQYEGRTWQGAIRDSVVDGATRWGITVHGCSYIDVSNNVVWDAQGSGINTENGQEWRCRFAGNFVGGVLVPFDLERGGVVFGNGNPVDTGGDGSGIWLRSGAHEVVGNVVHGCFQSAYQVNGYYSQKIDYLPAQPGDLNDTHLAEVPPGDGFPHVIDWYDNEAASCGIGLWLTWHQLPYSNGITLFERDTFGRMTIANCAIGAEIWHETACDLVDFVVMADPSAMGLFTGEAFNALEPSQTCQGLMFNAINYENGGHRVFNATIENVAIGLLTPRNMAGPDTTQHPAGTTAPPTVDETTFLEPVGRKDFLVYDSYIKARAPVFVGKLHTAGRRVVMTGMTLAPDPTISHQNNAWPGRFVDDDDAVWLGTGSNLGGYVELNGQVIFNSETP